MGSLQVLQVRIQPFRALLYAYQNQLPTIPYEEQGNLLIGWIAHDLAHLIPEFWVKEMAFQFGMLEESHFAAA
jgi:hypothetical protein